MPVLAGVAGALTSEDGPSAVTVNRSLGRAML